MSRGSGAGYDRHFTITSPEGQVSKVAVKAAGTTATGVCGKDCVCIVTQKEVPDKLLDQTIVSHLFPTTKYLGLLATGMKADAWTVVQQARNEVAEFQSKYGYNMPVNVLSELIASKSKVYTEHADMRALGVISMVLSIDEEKGPQLYKCDPAGHILGHKAINSGFEGQEVTNFLEKKMRNNFGFTHKETVQATILGLQSILQEDLKATEIEVGVVINKKPILRILTTEEVNEHLTAIRERDSSDKSNR